MTSDCFAPRLSEEDGGGGVESGHLPILSPPRRLLNPSSSRARPGPRLPSEPRSKTRQAPDQVRGDDMENAHPSRLREGQRDLRACPLVAAGWADATPQAHPRPLPQAGGEIDVSYWSVPVIQSNLGKPHLSTVVRVPDLDPRKHHARRYSSIRLLAGISCTSASAKPLVSASSVTSSSQRTPHSAFRARRFSSKARLLGAAS